MAPARTAVAEIAGPTPQRKMPPPRRPVLPPAQRMPDTDSSHGDKRLSLGSSKQTSGGHAFAPHTPSSSISTTPTTATGSVISADTPMSPRDSGSFLTALAAQERRVLELKEDLQRAEADLALLKSQWATHEATRKRDEIRHVEQLQPLGLPLNNGDGNGEEYGGSFRMSKEIERRKAMYASTSPPKRKVFLGSRHTRTLSLLTSNTTTNRTQPSSPDKDLNQTGGESFQPVRLPRSSSMLEVTVEPGEKTAGRASSNRRSIRGPPREAILRTGKQIAVDFREGLWTFIEDLRQATVGDEGISATESRMLSTSPSRAAKRQSSKGSLRNKDGRITVLRTSKGVYAGTQSTNVADDSALIDVGGAFGPKIETGDTRAKSSSQSLRFLQPTSQEKGASDDESWEDWDSPTAKVHSPRCSTSPLRSDLEGSSSTYRSSSHTSARYVGPKPFSIGCSSNSSSYFAMTPTSDLACFFSAIHESCQRCLAILFKKRLVTLANGLILLPSVNFRRYVQS